MPNVNLTMDAVYVVPETLVEIVLLDLSVFCAVYMCILHMYYEQNQFSLEQIVLNSASRASYFRYIQCRLFTNIK